MKATTNAPKTKSLGSVKNSAPLAGARPGYKHAKLGWRPEEWDVLPFGSAVSIRNGQVDPLDDRYADMTLVAPNHIAPGTGQLIERVSAKEQDAISGKYLVEAGQVIYSKIRPYLRKAVITQEKCLCSADAYPLSGKEGLTNEYLLLTLLSERFTYYVTKSSARTGIPKVNRDELGDFMLTLPPLTEQRRITAVLGAWDRAISTTQQLVAAQQQRKQGLIQELLTGKRRFPGFKGKWKNVRLGDLVERVTRKNDVGEDHVLTISALQGLIDQREIFNKSVAGANLAGYYLLHRGEFAYNKSSSNGFPFGAIKRLDRYEQGVLSTLYICFRLKTDVGSSDFFAAYFDSGLLDKGISMVAQEGARNHGLLNIGTSDFFDIDLHVPDTREQAVIAKAIGMLNTETEGLRNYLDHLTIQKRGLMQQLLTGAVRVKH